MNIISKDKVKPFLNMKKFRSVFRFICAIRTKRKRMRVRDESAIRRMYKLYVGRTTYFSNRNYLNFYCKFYNIFISKFKKAFLIRKKIGKSYFRVDFNREHPYYIILTYKYIIRKVFSTGFLLKLYNLPFKSMRRNPEKYTIIISFFKRFFKHTRLRLRSIAILMGYRYKYGFFINNLILSFISLYCSGLFIATQTKMLNYCFRRVKAIKKRIKKRIIKDAKKIIKLKIKLNKK